MKQIYLLFIGLILLVSCSKDSNNDGEIELDACFSISKEILDAGESFTISSCSRNAALYAYTFGDGNGSSDANPEYSYAEGGEYTITLTVTGDNGETDTFTLIIIVIGAEAKFIYPEIPSGFSAIPFEAGINPNNGNFYSIELWEDNVGPGGEKYYYQELDANFELTTHYLADRPFNANSAFVNFYDSGNMNFVFARTLNDLYGTQEITYNGAWSFLNGINSATKHSYGSLRSGADHLYFGTEDDGIVYKTAIETRNSSGDAYQVALNSFGTADAMLGDMIETGDGYAAFGAVFTKNAGAPYITGYKPLLVFFDAALSPTSHVIYEDSVLDSKINTANDLNGSFHLIKLSNGNLAMYANGELTVTDAMGSKLSSVYFEGTQNNQALYKVDDGFILTSADYLRKFNTGGTEIKSIKYDGDHTPELLPFSGAIFFISGYEVGGEVKMFYGAMDQDLNILDLNP